MFQFEDAAKEVADEVTRPRPEGEDEVFDIQVTLTSAKTPSDIRQLQVCISKILLKFITWEFMLLHKNYTVACLFS